MWSHRADAAQEHQHRSLKQSIVTAIIFVLLFSLWLEVSGTAGVALC